MLVIGAEDGADKGRPDDQRDRLDTEPGCAAEAIGGYCLGWNQLCFHYVVNGGKLTSIILEGRGTNKDKGYLVTSLKLVYQRSRYTVPVISEGRDKT